MSHAFSTIKYILQDISRKSSEKSANLPEFVENISLVNGEKLIPEVFEEIITIVEQKVIN